MAVPHSLLVFDLDGTLVDSSESICSAVNQAREFFGYPTAESRYLHKRIGLPAEALFEDLHLNEDQLFRIVGIFREKLSIGIEDGITFFPGVLNFLRAAKVHDFFTAIATNKPSSLARKLVSSCELNTLIDFTVGIGEFLPKPNPSMISHCSNRFKVTNVTMFGDRIEDMQAAVSAGVLAVGVLQSFHTEENLLESGASFVFRDFEAIHHHFDTQIWEK